MNLNLKVDSVVKYSQREKALFKLLTRANGRVSSEKLLHDLFKNEDEVPFHGRTSMMGALRSLKAKVVRNKEPFRIMSSTRQGPYPIEFWVEAKRGGAERKSA